MVPRFYPLFTFLFFAVAHASTNDWSVPCFNGECTYELPQTEPYAGSGFVKLNGSPDAITDITEAAGWQVIGCDSHAMAQDIRIVCVNNDTAQSGCNHLYQNTSPVDKIVRLPENCGKMPFARIANESVATNQTIPSHISKRLVRRGGVLPQVKSLSIDTNFTAMHPAKAGNINITIQGSNIPGASPSGSVGRRGVVETRGCHHSGFLDLDWNCNGTIAPASLNITENLNLINAVQPCPQIGQTPAFNASISAEVDIDAYASLVLGVTASGTFISISDFSLFANFSADINGELSISASAAGSISSSKSLLSQPFAGFHVPAFLSIGPVLNISSETSVEVDVNLDLQVGMNYHVENAQLVFPESPGHTSSGNFNLTKSPVKFSAPNGAASVTLAAHLIPELDFGIEVLGGTIAEAVAFLNLDAGAETQLSLENSSTPNGKAANASDTVCIDVDASFAVNAGVRGELLGDSEQLSVLLYNDTLPLFNTCPGDSPAARKRQLTEAIRPKDINADGALKKASVIPHPRRSNALHRNPVFPRTRHTSARNRTISNLRPRDLGLECIALQALDVLVDT